MLSEHLLALITKELAGEIDPVEKAELERSLATEPRYKDQYKLYKAYWKNKDHNYTNPALAFKKVKARIHNDNGISEVTGPAKKTMILRYWSQIAAVLFLSVALLFFYHRSAINKTNAAAWQEKRTTAGTRSSLTLSDGTKVLLNSNSHFKFPNNFKGAQREVYLMGEAYFEVHKDTQHPFIIHTQKINIKVLGTEFNLKAYPNDRETETTLIRGSVEVTLKDRPSDRIILKPDEKLVVTDRITGTKKRKSFSRSVTPLTSRYTLTNLSYYKQTDTTAIETSWTQNKLVFKNKPFDELARQMERRYGYSILFKNEKLKDLRFTASFEKETVEQVLKALQFTEDFQYRVASSTITIY